MASALLIAALLIGVVACPLIAVVQRRRGWACCPPGRSRAPGTAGESLARLRADRQRVGEQIRVLEREASTGDPARR